ncbi:ParA family protein [bacterium]|nr:ParA family protein [candidate division CSSED10-310 bacterium]
MKFPKPRIIAVTNQKGGSGKTTTSVNLAAALALNERKVLLVDLDPQANATIGLGFSSTDLDKSIYHVLIDPDAEMPEIVRKTDLVNLDLVPATIHLSGAEVELVNTIGREITLREKLLPVVDRYDYIIIDCPPSLGLLTLNALTTAREIIIPVQTHFYALEGMSLLMNTIDLVRKRLNHKLNITGILATIYQSGTKLSERVMEELRKYFGKQVFETIIRMNVKLAEAPGHGQPVMLYDSESNGAVDYMDLAREVISGEL